MSHAPAHRSRMMRLQVYTFVVAVSLCLATSFAGALKGSSDEVGKTDVETLLKHNQGMVESIENENLDTLDEPTALEKYQEKENPHSSEAQVDDAPLVEDNMERTDSPELEANSSDKMIRAHEYDHESSDTGARVYDHTSEGSDIDTIAADNRSEVSGEDVSQITELKTADVPSDNLGAAEDRFNSEMRKGEETEANKGTDQPMGTHEEK